MAARQYSAHQRKIINRYYEHLDTIAINRLGELVSELYLAADAKKAERLWQRVETLLERVSANDAEVRKLLTDRSVERLAELLNRITLSAEKKDRRSGGGRG